MFSATFPDDIQTSAQVFLDDYIFLTVGMVGGACADIAQTFEKVAKFDKRDKLDELLNNPDRDPTERTLIFSQVCSIDGLIHNFSSLFYYRRRKIATSSPVISPNKVFPPPAYMAIDFRGSARKPSMISRKEKSLSWWPLLLLLEDWIFGG